MNSNKTKISDNLHNVYKNVFDSLQHLEISRQTYPPNRSKIYILFRYAPHYGIIMHTSYLPTGQRSRLKEVIQMQISSDINPRRRRNNQFFLSCFTRSASSFLFIRFTFLVLVRFLRGFSLFVYSHLFFGSFTLFF